MSNRDNITQASQRFDRPRNALRKAVNARLRESSIVVLTEVKGRMAFVRAPKRGTHRADGVAIVWKKSVWRCIERDRIFYRKPWEAKGGRIVKIMGAPIVVLEHKATGERVVVAGMHPPAGVEPGFAKQGLERQRAYVRHVRAVRKRVNHYVKKHKAAGMISADWNLNLHSAEVREFFRKEFPHWHGWQPRYLPKGGSLGYRYIDTTLTKRVRRQRSRIHPKHKSSDHRAVTTPWRFMK